MNTELKIINTESEIEKAKKIYLNAFDDNNEFVNFFYNEYKTYCTYYGGYVDNELVFITTIVKKRIHINDENEFANFIVGVATKEEYKRKGLMFKFLLEIIELNSLQKLFIQSKDWNLYSKFNFKPCTIKSQWILKEDQILHKKKDELFESINYNQINKIRNIFNSKYFDNFTYRTEKENKKILKMHIIGNDKIYQTQNAYIIVSNNIVIDYGFIELIDFIKLLSNFKYNELKINSIIELDKRFFKKIDNNFIETKVYELENIEINFNEYF